MSIAPDPPPVPAQLNEIKATEHTETTEQIKRFVDIESSSVSFVLSAADRSIPLHLEIDLDRCPCRRERNVLLTVPGIALPRLEPPHPRGDVVDPETPVRPDP